MYLSCENKLCSSHTVSAIVTATLVMIFVCIDFVTSVGLLLLRHEIEFEVVTFNLYLRYKSTLIVLTTPYSVWLAIATVNALLWLEASLLACCLNYAWKFVLIADWFVAHFVVIVNDVMNDNMAAFAHVGARLGVFFYWTRCLENNVPFDNVPL